MALVADFQANQARLDTLMQSQDRVVAAHGRATQPSSTAHTSRPPAELASLFSPAGDTEFFRYEPITGAYDALVSSGDLGRVRDSELSYRGSWPPSSATSRGPTRTPSLGDLARSALWDVDRCDAPICLQSGWIRVFGATLPESSVQPDFDRLFASSRYQTQLAGVAIIERNQRNEFRQIYSW